MFFNVLIINGLSTTLPILTYQKFSKNLITFKNRYYNYVNQKIQNDNTKDTI